MELIKELIEDLRKIPRDIREDLTPLGKWTIWIPFSCVAIILLIVFDIIMGVMTFFNYITNDSIIKIYDAIERSLFKPEGI